MWHLNLKTSSSKLKTQLLQDVCASREFDQKGDANSNCFEVPHYELSLHFFDVSSLDLVNVTHFLEKLAELRRILGYV